MPESPPSLAALRRQIALMQSGSAPVRTEFATGHDDLDATLHGGLTRGKLHEVFAAGIDDACSTAGFAAMLALRAGAAAPLLWLRTETAERAGGGLYMPGLAELGGDPDSLILALLPNDRTLLKAAADAAMCHGLGALVVECWGRAPLYDLTASRRLALAAEKSGVLLLVLRVDAEPGPSAAETRWSVAAAPSHVLAPDAPGAVMLDVELLRRRAGPAGMRWQVEWNREQRALRNPALPGAMATLSRYRTVDPGRGHARRTA